jgi:hypothetical protein
MAGIVIVGSALIGITSPFVGYGVGKVAGSIIDYFKHDDESTYSKTMKKIGGMAGLGISALCGNTLYTFYTALQHGNKNVRELNYKIL